MTKITPATPGGRSDTQSSEQCTSVEGEAKLSETSKADWPPNYQTDLKSPSVTVEERKWSPDGRGANKSAMTEVSGTGTVVAVGSAPDRLAAPVKKIKSCNALDDVHMIAAYLPMYGNDNITCTLCEHSLLSDCASATDDPSVNGVVSDGSTMSTEGVGVIAAGVGTVAEKVPQFGGVCTCVCGHCAELSVCAQSTDLEMGTAPRRDIPRKLMGKTP